MTSGVDAEFKMSGDHAITEFNLRCPSGHCWYSPNPEVFVGSDCGVNLAEGKCREKLELR